MDADSLSKVVAAFVSLVQVLIWPLLVLFLLVRFGRPLDKFLDNMGEFSFKASATGFEATAKRQLEAAALLAIANASKQGTTAGSQPPARPAVSEGNERSANLEDTSLGGSIVNEVPSAEHPKETARHIANVVSQSITPRTIRRLADASVLWVDDHPENNVYEQQALEALGIHFDTSTSTQDALEKLRRNTYDVIISDMGRGSDRTAGYTLLQELKKLGIATPFFIYAGSATPGERAEALKRGVFARTNNPQELFQLVTAAIQKR